MRSRLPPKGQAIAEAVGEMGYLDIVAAQLGSPSNQDPGGSAYSLAKQMVAHYVGDLSIPLVKSWIRSNALHPANVNTDMLHNEGMYWVFLASVDSRYITGAQLCTDAGGFVKAKAWRG